MTFDWRRPLIYTHRWLGIAGGVFFAMWFASGIVMMYARMPSLAPEERLMRLPVLDLSRVRVRPAEAARIAGLTPERVRVAMLGDRPVYRVSDGGPWATVFADNGQMLAQVTPDEALDIARRFAPERRSAVRYDAFLPDADQWTFSVRGAVPLHRLALDETGDAVLYVSAQSGEVVMKTTQAGRRWGYLGAVPHWLYFAALRRHPAIWAPLIVWLSIAGCVLSLSGLVWGIWRYSRARRYRLKRVLSHTPYAGLMRWHHYAGLVFGLATFTWIFSGLLSMDPWAWSPETSPTHEQQEAVDGGPLNLNELLAADVRDGAAVLGTEGDLRGIEIIQFQGTLYLAAERAPAGVAGSPSSNRRLVPAFALEQGAFDRFDDSAVLWAARAAMRGVAIEDAQWLQSYDAYYYDREGALPLPVLRVRFMDPARTWLYLDPRSGAIVQKEERLSRVNRWLYHGLHSLDIPFLYYRRPLWDIVIIVLSAGGIVLSLTTMPVGWHRIRRLSRSFMSSRGDMQD